MSWMNQLSTAEKIVGLLGAAGLAYTTWSSGRIQNDLSVQKAQIDQVISRQQVEMELRRDAREAAKEQNALTETIFKHFVDAITDKDPDAAARVDRLHGVLVLAYAIPDPRQQEAMATAVQKAMQRIEEPGVASRVREGTFDAEELVLASAAQRLVESPPAETIKPAAAGGRVSWGNYDFDIFWCEEVAESATLQERAAKILALKSLDPSSSGRWRQRPLPKLVNERPSYGVRGLQIRYSASDEQVLAEALKTRIETILPDSNVMLVPSSQSTPWYLSVFVCS